jgi:metallo-beta-lactamase class B
MKSCRLRTLVVAGLVVAMYGADTSGQSPLDRARQTPSRETWYQEPVKVFDNLYFAGTKIHSSWAVSTSHGLIVIDALFD